MKTCALVLALALGTANAFQSLSKSGGPRATRGGVRMAVPCGINGFGRIGRLVARIMLKNPETDLTLINSGASAEYMAYQFKYDSIHGKYDGVVEIDNDSLIIDGQIVSLSHTRDPGAIPFAMYGAEYICESTGAFLTKEKIKPHLMAGAKKVVFSAPAKDDSPVVVGGPVPFFSPAIAWCEQATKEKNALTRTCSVAHFATEWFVCVRTGHGCEPRFL